MIERLDHETRMHHVDADRELDALFQPDLTRSDYLQFLLRAYGFETPLDNAIAMTPNLDRILDLPRRSRAGFLAKDLVAMGLRTAEVTLLPVCLAIPQFRSVSEAMGWMYVLERSTLSHNVLRRHLRAQLPLDTDVGSAYLGSYDGVAGRRWQELGTALDEVAQHPAIAERIIVAAGDAFRSRRTWTQQEAALLARSAG